MPLQLQYDYHFSTTMKEKLKRQFKTPYSYFTSSASYYPEICRQIDNSDLPKMTLPNSIPLTKDQLQEMVY